MTLYEINAEIADAIESMFDSVNEETGEIDAGTVERLQELKALQAEKRDGCGAFLKNEIAELNAIKDEIEKLTARKKIKENRIERLKKYLADDLAAEISETNKNPKFESSRVSLSLRSSESVEIMDDLAIPAEFMKIKTTTEPDKTAIKKAIKAGESVSGAVLITKNNLQIK
jgi:predicted transcriptional regulator